MEMTITAKIQLKTTEEQKRILSGTMDAYRKSCKYVSDYVFSNHDYKQLSVHNSVYEQVRSLYKIGSQMTCSVIRTVLARYKSIKSSGLNCIKPKFKLPQYDLVWNRDYSLNKNVFSVNTLEGRIKIPYYSKVMEQYFDRSKYTFGTAKIVNKKGKFFLHIPVSFEVPECDESQIQNVVGVDRGINFIVTTYDSKGKTGFVSGRNIKHIRARYCDVRKQLQMRKTSSSRRRLRLIGSRENRWMQDVNHCISKALVLNHPKNSLFVLEDLSGIRNRRERIRRKFRYVSVSWSFYDLEQKIDYKVKKYGSKMIKVNPAYTSQTCPKCGHTEKSNRDKSKHLFTCRNCGYRSNDDRIGAMNLYRMGIEYLVPGTVTSEHDLEVRGFVSDPDVTPRYSSRNIRENVGESKTRLLQGSHKPISSDVGN